MPRKFSLSRPKPKVLILVEVIQPSTRNKALNKLPCLDFYSAMEGGGWGGVCVKLKTSFVNIFMNDIKIISKELMRPVLSQTRKTSPHYKNKSCKCLSLT